MIKEKPELSSEKTDYELITDYLAGNDHAFELLMRRHYNKMHKRFLSITCKLADADDLSQKLWLKILQHLPKYKDEQKFPQFLSKVATNLLRDDYRKASPKALMSLDNFGDDDSSYDLPDTRTADPSDTTHSQSEIAYLIETLIPNLKENIRTVFLLRHEAEFWDGKSPLQWQHLAAFHQLDVAEASQIFTNTRDGLLTNTSGSSNAKELSWQEKSVFLIWTQSHRFDKSIKQTEKYLAELLQIPVNTFKTHYRTATTELNAGMEKWRNSH